MLEELPELKQETTKKKNLFYIFFIRYIQNKYKKMYIFNHYSLIT